MARKKVKTYASKKVIIAWGSHVVTGYAEDSFVTVDPHGEGVNKVVGCDGEIARSLDPNQTYTVKLSVLQTSDSNAFFNKMQKLDSETGEGVFPLLITDLMGGTIFSADEAWLQKGASRVWGKANQNREWTFDTGEAEYNE